MRDSPPPPPTTTYMPAQRVDLLMERLIRAFATVNPPQQSHPQHIDSAQYGAATDENGNILAYIPHGYQLGKSIGAGSQGVVL